MPDRDAPAQEAPAQETPDQEAPPPKLHDNWVLVLLRGLIEGLLVVILFLPSVQTTEALLVFVAATIAGGSVVELIMAYRLPGHAFRGILIFTGIAGLGMGGFLLYNYPGTLDLLLVMTGLWVAIRGFASLWLGLSIVAESTFDRVVPIVAGVIGFAAGAWAMIWLDVEVGVFAWLLAIYGAASLAVHLLVALRMRAEHQRRVLQEG